VCLHDAADSRARQWDVSCVSVRSECLATSTSTVDFCSYHSQLNLDGVEVPYVVQPWTPVTACDEPDAIPLPTPDDPPVNPQDLTNSLGSKLLSPISQGQIAAITNPFGNGWFSSDGVETSDCAPLNVGRDLEPVNGNVYPLRRAFSDSGVISIDPNSPECAPNGDLQATFVAPDAVNPGDTVELDGSNSISSLLVTKYAWDFGDGATTSGPSVAHSYSKPGQYAIKLTVTDRGGNTSTSRRRSMSSARGARCQPRVPTPRHGPLEIESARQRRAPARELPPLAAARRAAQGDDERVGRRHRVGVDLPQGCEASADQGGTRARRRDRARQPPENRVWRLVTSVCPRAW